MAYVFGSCLLGVTSDNAVSPIPPGSSGHEEEKWLEGTLSKRGQSKYLYSGGGGTETMRTRPGQCYSTLGLPGRCQPSKLLIKAFAGPWVKTRVGFQPGTRLGGKRTCARKRTLS